MRLNLSRRLVNGLSIYVYVCTIRRWDRLRFCYLFQFPLGATVDRQVLWTLTLPVMLQSRHFSHACNVHPLLGTSTILAHWLKFIVSFTSPWTQSKSMRPIWPARARTHSHVRIQQSFRWDPVALSLSLTPSGRRSTFSFAYFVAVYILLNIIIFYDCDWHICVCPMRQQNNWKFTNESLCCRATVSHTSHLYLQCFHIYCTRWMYLWIVIYCQSLCK